MGKPPHDPADRRTIIFALTFSLALVQGSSIVAFAGGTISKDVSAPVVTDDGSDSDGSSGPAATESLNADDGAGGTGSGGSAAAPAAVEPDEPGPPSGNGIQPALLIGNQNYAEVIPEDQFLFEYPDNSPSDDRVDLAFASGGLVEGTLVIEVDEGAQTFDFEVEDGDPVVAVVVKGGSNATFCFAKEVVAPPVPDIDVEKTCPATVPAGQPIDDTITSEITVSNAGNEDLENITVSDTVRDLSTSFGDTFAVGVSETHEFDHTARDR